ncbi:prephenate dehydratase [Tistrella bauzanensis]|uniref:prephenate dehydratase n=1 Tax=Tistrella bauzanensis TaxID=657419 RepID=A0ABQ1J9G5_9PROT|nr:prephenate dehydratase [Tistrella bauzanensis]GGB61881.1 prephenate dehydratase [Tistrella bauzanensis]
MPASSPMSRPAPHRPADIISFQGQPGAYSHMACRQMFPDMVPLPCPTFADAIDAVREGQADQAMIPIDNTLAGRVADVHRLLPRSGLSITGEHFMRVSHCLLGVPGASLGGVRTALSHVHALSQCHVFMEANGIRPVVHSDTASAAARVAELQDPTVSAIASRLSAEIYGLDVLAEAIEDAEHNTTRFVVMMRDKVVPAAGNGPVVTSFIFQVRNVPAALYKALGGFATNGVNMTKLENYLIDGAFTPAVFYADIEGHPDDRSVALAMEELRFFSTDVRILGIYPASPDRLAGGPAGGAAGLDGLPSGL